MVNNTQTIKIIEKSQIQELTEQTKASLHLLH